MNVDLIAHLDASNIMYVRDGNWVSIPTNMGFVRADLQTRKWSVGGKGVEHIGLQKLINLLKEPTNEQGLVGCDAGIIR